MFTTLQLLSDVKYCNTDVKKILLLYLNISTFDRIDLCHLRRACISGYLSMIWGKFSAFEDLISQWAAVQFASTSLRVICARV